MANRYHGNLTGNGKLTGGGHTEPSGGGSSPQGKTGTANWPGLPGKSQGSDRSGGVSKSGHMGPFSHKKEGL